MCTASALLTDLMGKDHTVMMQLYEPMYGSMKQPVKSIDPTMPRGDFFVNYDKEEYIDMRTVNHCTLSITTIDVASPEPYMLLQSDSTWCCVKTGRRVLTEAPFII